MSLWTINCILLYIKWDCPDRFSVWRGINLLRLHRISRQTNIYCSKLKQMHLTLDLDVDTVIKDLFLPLETLWPISRSLSYRFAFS